MQIISMFYKTLQIYKTLAELLYDIPYQIHSPCPSKQHLFLNTHLDRINKLVTIDFRDTKPCYSAHNYKEQQQVQKFQSA